MRIVVVGPVAELTVGVASPATDRRVRPHGTRMANATIELGHAGKRPAAPDHLHRLEAGVQDRVARGPVTDLVFLVGTPAPGGPVLLRAQEWEMPAATEVTPVRKPPPRRT